MTDKIVVLSTCGSAEEAEKIARGVLEQRLVACVNVVAGLRSLYWWRGALEDAAEWLLIMKTRQDLFEPLRSEIQRLHSYEVPEVVAVPIAAGSDAYLNWIGAEVRSAAG